MTWLAAHRKAIVAAVGLVVVVLTRALGVDDPIVQDVIALATALGVYGTPNAA